MTTTTNPIAHAIADERDAIRCHAALQQRRHDVAYLRAYGYRDHVWDAVGEEAVTALCDGLEDLEIFGGEDDQERCGECGDVLTDEALTTGTGACVDCHREPEE